MKDWFLMLRTFQLYYVMKSEHWVKWWLLWMFYLCELLCLLSSVQWNGSFKLVNLFLHLMFTHSVGNIKFKQNGDECLQLLNFLQYISLAGRFKSLCCFKYVQRRIHVCYRATTDYMFPLKECCDTVPMLVGGS